MDGWNTSFLIGMAYFQELLLLVSGRDSIQFHPIPLAVTSWILRKGEAHHTWGVPFQHPRNPISPLKALAICVGGQHNRFGTFSCHVWDRRNSFVDPNWSKVGILVVTHSPYCSILKTCRCFTPMHLICLVVFWGAIMRHSPRIRSLVCQGIAFRMELNFSINAVFDGEHESEHFILVFSDLFFFMSFWHICIDEGRSAYLWPWSQHAWCDVFMFRCETTTWLRMLFQVAWQVTITTHVWCWTKQIRKGLGLGRFDSRAQSGVIKLPIWGDQTMQIYGNFERIPVNKSCLGW